MSVLLDADVLLDVACSRAPWKEASGAVLDRCQAGQEEAFVSWHSLANVYYCARKEGKEKASEFLRALLRFAQVAPVATRDMLFALEQPMQDLEDAMNVAAAVACRATWIITRNTSHYAKSRVPAMTPTRFLAEVAR